MFRIPIVTCLAGLAVVAVAPAAEVITIADAAALRAALPSLKPGTTLRISAGEYPGNFHVDGIANLTVEGADPANPPHFRGGGNAWHFSQCSGLVLRNLRISGQTGNGLNLDDGGDSGGPTKNLTLEKISVSNVGPRGNRDGIKCSGLDDLIIRDCSIEAWGGEAIDLVGCHRVLITGCRFVGQPTHSQATGVQCKGGSEDVTVEKCEFMNAGQRPINAGGSTGMPYFRPRDAKYEARRIIIRENTITGSLCACAFTGVDGAEFRGNTVLYPEKWIFRILQETTEPDFVPSRNGVIEDNKIIFRRSQVQIEVNVSPHTAPETFRFARNQWFAEDRPERSKPRLPHAEVDGVYGRDPR